ncbi:uncharacterized protein HKW66_Vig0239200 [Vigna angularis]|uniref:Uncharacterized protein n=1 Tax=Phaseolus angularis TaxID=3914 RepID=A0A8T0KWS7_PHAAN|nr:uncharacterized protein HKW66_Vig0239200 [Vigna angularis]
MLSLKYLLENVMGLTNMKNKAYFKEMLQKFKPFSIEKVEETLDIMITTETLNKWSLAHVSAGLLLITTRIGRRTCESSTPVIRRTFVTNIRLGEKIFDLTNSKKDLYMGLSCAKILNVLVELSASVVLLD